MVMKEGMVLVVVGGVIGAGLAALGSQAISSVLYVGPFDVLSFATAFSGAGLGGGTGERGAGLACVTG
jgi:hypothetical protein